MKPSQPNLNTDTKAQNAMPPTDANALLTVQDVAKRWQTSRASVYRAIGNGRLKIVKLGPALTRFRHEDVVAAEQPE
jgi:excisionase family DNA binding protein